MEQKQAKASKRKQAGPLWLATHRAAATSGGRQKGHEPHGTPSARAQADTARARCVHSPLLQVSTSPAGAGVLVCTLQRKPFRAWSRSAWPSFVWRAALYTPTTPTLLLLGRGVTKQNRRPHMPPGHCLLGGLCSYAPLHPSMLGGLRWETP
jgi:hypothetical protein